MALLKSLTKTSVIVWSLVLGTLFVLTSLAAISVLGTKTSGKFKSVAYTVGTTDAPGSTKPAPASPDTPASSEPSKTSQ